MKIMPRVEGLFGVALVASALVFFARLREPGPPDRAALVTRRMAALKTDLEVFARRTAGDPEDQTVITPDTDAELARLVAAGRDPLGREALEGFLASAGAESARAAALALDFLGDPRSLPALLSARRRFGAGSGVGVVCHHALTVAVQRPDGVGALLDWCVGLGAADAPLVRDLAQFLLEGETATVQPVLARLLWHPAPELRDEALAALAQWRGGRGVPLLAAAAFDGDRALRLAALGALGDSREPAALELLRAAARGLGAPEDRIAALRALARFPHPEAEREISAAAALDPGPVGDVARELLAELRRAHAAALRAESEHAESEREE